MKAKHCMLYKIQYGFCILFTTVTNLHAYDPVTRKSNDKHRNTDTDKWQDKQSLRAIQFILKKYPQDFVHRKW